MRKFTKKKFMKTLAIVASAIMALSMNLPVMADGEDIVLDDAGSPFIKTFDPGDEGDYKYMGYVYCFEAPAEYKYLQITYTGDSTAFDQLRLEFVQNSDPEEEIKLPVIWFSENEEGTFVTTTGGLVPAPSSEEQTVVIDLEASGLDCSEGFRAFHVHDTPGSGSFTIVDARLTTSPGQESTVAASENTTKAAADKEETTVSTDSEAVTTVAAGATTDNGSVDAPKTGSPVMPIAVACGGVVVALVAFAISRKFNEEV